MAFIVAFSCYTPHHRSPSPPPMHNTALETTTFIQPTPQGSSSGTVLNTLPQLQRKATKRNCLKTTPYYWFIGSCLVFSTVWFCPTWLTDSSPKMPPFAATLNPEMAACWVGCISTIPKDGVLSSSLQSRAINSTQRKSRLALTHERA